MFRHAPDALQLSTGLTSAIDNFIDRWRPCLWNSIAQYSRNSANAGTVEYLYSEWEAKLYFLALNPRLQVEHPITEMIS